MASTESAGAKPIIVVLTLDKPEFFNDMYEGFPAAILVADASLTVSTRISLVHNVLSYVRSGGVLVFMALFPGFARPPDVKSLFSRLDLLWRAGSYHRSTFRLNSDMRHFKKSGLAESYSQKALHLADVTYDDAVYLPTDDWEEGSSVSGPSDRIETPVAFAKMGEGRVGYVGDVNDEDDMTPVILGMCGL
ncbi:hypothetical protein MBLNU13_g06279t1 [Cladosporium sp. NU13]